MINSANMLYAIEPPLNLLYILIHGSVETKDLFQYDQVVWNNPLRRPGMQIIVDITLVTDLSFELRDIQAQIEMNERVLAQGHTLERTAVIMRNSYDLTLGRIVDDRVQRAVPISMGVFLTMREAVDWLGLSDAYDRIAEIQRALRLRAIDTTA